METHSVVAKSDIDQQSAFLDAKWEKVMAVPQTYRVHCIQAYGPDEVKAADTSDKIDKCSVFVESAIPMSLHRPI